MKQKELDIRIKELYFKQTVSIKDNDKGRVDLAKKGNSNSSDFKRND